MTPAHASAANEPPPCSALGKEPRHPAAHLLRRSKYRSPATPRKPRVFPPGLPTTKSIKDQSLPLGYLNLNIRARPAGHWAIGQKHIAERDHDHGADDHAKEANPSTTI